MAGTVVGISGGIGSGKSRVSRFWAGHFSLPLIDLDAICRDLLRPGQEGWRALQAAFGNRYFAANGSLDRAALRRAIFADHGLRRQLDDLLHPLARRAMRRALAAQAATATVLVEIPLLLEAGWRNDVDRVVVVYAGPGVRCRRIMARDRVDRRQALQAIASQMRLADKALMADHVLDNSGAWADTCLQVIHLGRLLAGSTGDAFPRSGADVGFL
ncbi:MAG TPA: dephospho-CoA kinase [Desulfobulbus sp.]|nr:dephospho-CoA kinase [Desulfobulbus sp.]